MTTVDFLAKGRRGVKLPSKNKAFAKFQFPTEEHMWLFCQDIRKTFEGHVGLSANRAERIVVV